MHLLIGSIKFILERGDITQQDVDAIVNAANSNLMGGGGVDGAIHRAGGPQILEECKAHVARYGQLPTGEAMMTSGGRMKSKYVIHTVGPVWQGGSVREDELLANAYRNSLRVAAENNVERVAFPCIGTGVYGFPTERAARIALHTVKQFVQEQRCFKEIRFVTYSQSDYRLYEQLFNAYKV